MTALPLFCVVSLKIELLFERLVSFFGNGTHSVRKYTFLEKIMGLLVHILRNDQDALQFAALKALFDIYLEHNYTDDDNTVILKV